MKVTEKSGQSLEFEDTTKVEKYEMSDAEYSQRSGSTCCYLAALFLLLSYLSTHGLLSIAELLLGMVWFCMNSAHISVHYITPKRIYVGFLSVVPDRL